MVRFILKRQMTLGEFGPPIETTYETVDLDVSVLREALLRGGQVDFTELVGVEVLPPAAPSSDTGTEEG